MKRAAILAAATSLVGMVGAFVLPGAANAQSGSRICGVEWAAEAQDGADPKIPKERIIKLYEVSKNNFVECSIAMDKGSSDGTPMDGPADLIAKSLHKKDNKLWNYVASYSDEMTCEWFMESVLKGKDFKLVGTNFPFTQPHRDICMNMNRSDTFFEMEAYWMLETQIPVLGQDGKPAKNKDGTPQTKMQWFLQRG